MAKTKKNYSIYIIAGIVIILVAALVYYSGGEVGQATWKQVGLKGKRNQAVACYFQYPPGTTKDQMIVNQCEGYNRYCEDTDKKGSCEFGIYEKEDEEYTVRSKTCEGTHRVKNDGRRRELKFDCKPLAQVQIQQQTAQCAQYKQTSAELRNKILDVQQKIDRLTQEIQQLTAQRTESESKLAENEQRAATACALPVCGNNQVELGEECDSTDRTKCTAACKTIVPVTPLAEDQVWHMYQCGSDRHTQIGGACPNKMPIDYDLGYILKNLPQGFSWSDVGTITYCQHMYGYYGAFQNEYDIKYNANCEPEDRFINAGYPSLTPTRYGYVFSTARPGTRLAYKCTKDYGANIRYNFRISFSPNCNAGQAGWEGYRNVGTLGYWLLKPEVPLGVGVQ